MGQCSLSYRGMAPFIVFLLSGLSQACLDVRSDDLEPDGSVSDGDRESCKACHHSSDAEELTRCDGCHAVSPNTKGHPVHIKWAASNQQATCVSCHVVPSKWFDDGHLDAVVQVVFQDGGLASTDGLTPSWDGSRCDDVYCHGASLRGGTNTAPLWDGAGTVKCGDCHGNPPLGGHPDSTACESCHRAAYLEDGSQDETKHRNGRIDMATESSR